MRRFSFWATTLTLLFLYLPILTLIVDSFNPSKFSIASQPFSFKWYIKLFAQREIWTAFQHTLLIAFSSTLVSTLFGSLAAFAIHKYRRSKLQKVHKTLLFSTLFIPDILLGISLLLFFVLLPLQLGLFTIFLSHTLFCLTYVTLIFLSRLEQFDFSVFEAAYDLGATPRQTFLRVFLPMMLPALIGAALLAITLSMDDFVITYFVAGPGAKTLPLYIYSMIKYGATPMINALSTLILFVSFITVLLTQYFSGDF